MTIEYLPTDQEVATINDLFALNVRDGQSVLVQGYWSAGDGGANRLIYDQGSDVAVDGVLVFPGKGGTMSLDASGVFDGEAGAGRYLKIDKKHVNILQVGATFANRDKEAALMADQYRYFTALNNTYYNAGDGSNGTTSSFSVYIPQGFYRCDTTVRLRLPGDEYYDPDSTVDQVAAGGSYIMDGAIWTAKTNDIIALEVMGSDRQSPAGRIQLNVRKQYDNVACRWETASVFPKRLDVEDPDGADAHLNGSGDDFNDCLNNVTDIGIRYLRTNGGEVYHGNACFYQINHQVTCGVSWDNAISTGMSHETGVFHLTGRRALSFSPFLPSLTFPPSESYSRGNVLVLFLRLTIR